MASGIGASFPAFVFTKALLGIFGDTGVEAASSAAEDVDKPLCCHGTHYIQRNINGASKGLFFPVRYSMVFACV